MSIDGQHGHEMSTSYITTDSTSTNQNVIELDWYEADDVVKVTPRNLRRFQIQKDRAINLLSKAAGASLQLDFLLDKLGCWCKKNSQKLSRAFLTIRDERFAFIAISISTACDDDLEDSVSELDFELANDSDLDLIKLNAFVLPPTSDEAVTSFLDNRFQLVYNVKHD